MNKKINEQTKFISKNPLVKLSNQHFLRSISDLIEISGQLKILDCGCGEGIVANYLLAENPKRSIYGLDLNKKSIAIAKKENPRASFKVGSVYKIPFRSNSFPLLLCTEVLEHLDSPHKALAELKRVSSRYVIISVPSEPFFRLSNLVRLKYLSRFGNTPGHIHNWTPFSFKKLIKRFFKIEKEFYPFPWMIFLVSV